MFIEKYFEETSRKIENTNRKDFIKILEKAGVIENILICFMSEREYNKYKHKGVAIVCTPKTRQKLFEEDGKNKHKDLNIKLTIERKNHKIKVLNRAINGWFLIEKLN